jgi:hypothetical protein
MLHRHRLAATVAILLGAAAPSPAWHHQHPLCLRPAQSSAVLTQSVPLVTTQAAVAPQLVTSQVVAPQLVTSQLATSQVILPQFAVAPQQIAAPQLGFDLTQLLSGAVSAAQLREIRQDLTAVRQDVTEIKQTVNRIDSRIEEFVKGKKPKEEGGKTPSGGRKELPDDQLRGSVHAAVKSALMAKGVTEAEAEAHAQAAAEAAVKAQTTKDKK